MTEQEILEGLTRIIRDVLDNDGIILSRETSASDIDDWDSVAHVRIMIAIEEDLEIRFEIEELTDIPSVGALIDLLKRKMSTTSQ